MNTANNAISQNQNSITIPKEDFPRIAWKLQHIESVIDLLHKKIIELRKSDNFVVLPSSEVCGFCDVLEAAYEDLNLLGGQLQASDVSEFREIGYELRKIAGYGGFVLNFLLPDLESDYKNIYRSDVDTISFLIEEIWIVLSLCLKGFKDLSVSDTKENINNTETYEGIIAERIKAIQPKFKTLSEKYIHSDGSELLTNREGVLRDTESLRNEIMELQSKMPSDSEGWADCRISLEELDFLIRLVNTRFEFRKSDVYELSLIVDKAGDNIDRIPDWLTPGEGGDLVDTIH